MKFFKTFLFLAAAVGGAGAGCGAPEIEGSEQPLGETTADRPSYAERLAFYACNRSRMDPNATGWPSYPAVPPLLWSDDLARSSRAHSQDMHDNACFQHPSCDGTDPFVRIKSYWTGSFSSLSENIAAGVQDGQEVVQNWIDEIGAAPGTTGHRDNMFDKMFRQTQVGLGYVPGGSKFNGYWTQDFAGVAPTPPIPRVSAGSHWPESTFANQLINFGAIYYDAAGAAPDRVELVLDGQTTPLKLVHGPAAAGAYEGAAAIATGCHRYYFRAVVGGKGSIYPDGGTLGVATSDVAAMCAAYSMGGVSADPAPPGGFGGKGGCSVGGRRASPTLAALVLLALAALARRRRG